MPDCDSSFVVVEEGAIPGLKIETGGTRQIFTSGLADGVIGQGYSMSLEAGGGTPAYKLVNYQWNATRRAHIRLLYQRNFWDPDSVGAITQPDDQGRGRQFPIASG